MSCRVARDGRLLRVTLARPEKRNALDAALCRALVEAVESATPGDTGAILLDAEGPSFCSGMDLGNSLQTGAAELASLHERLFTLGRRTRVPIVAHVQGHAIAGGTGLAANAHVVIADEDAKFGLTELRVAMWPFLIYRAVEEALGPRRTLAWTLHAGTYSAAEAREAGLVHSIGNADSALAAARQLAGRLPDAVALGMRYYRESRGLDHGASGTLAARLRTELMASAGYAAAVEEFRSRKK
jgi:enoyl-CoA hydratase/carnithine racemase